ncbi:MAG: signal recognition particle protein [Sumerlaeia bacterium]
MFDGLSEKFENLFGKLRRQQTLTEDNIKEALREVRMALLEADVNYIIVKDFVAGIREQAVGENIVKGVNPADQFFAIVQKGLEKMMTGDESVDKKFDVKPGQNQEILMLGLQGAGKTTFCGKLAKHLRKFDVKPLLVACDIYRPAAIEQLKQVGKSQNIPVFEMGTDHTPVEIILKARERAKELGCDCLIIDTAGRLAIDEVKMDELRAIRETIKPDYTFLVADAMTGQDAVNSAQKFHEEVGIDGVCLTKLDGDARGGAALSIKAVTSRPVVFVGVGEKADDLEPFYADRAAQRILGMGDVKSLIDKAEEAMRGEDADKLKDKLAKGQFNYNDFVKQMGMINKMGSIKGLMSMIPGVGGMLRGLDMDDDVMKKEMRRVESMISSMTKEERLNPDLVRDQIRRRYRVAAGSGHKPQQVSALISQFEQMRGMMQSMAGNTGMFGKMKNMAASQQAMPKPDDILSGKGAAPMMPGGMPADGKLPKGFKLEDMGITPNMPEYKKYKRQLKAYTKQQEAEAGTPVNRKKKNRKKSSR